VNLDHARGHQHLHRKSASRIMESIQNAVLHPLKDFKAENVANNMSGPNCGHRSRTKSESIYVAAASGGVWKTEDNGSSFTADLSSFQGRTESAICSFAPIMISGRTVRKFQRSTYAAQDLQSTDAWQTGR